MRAPDEGKDEGKPVTVVEHFVRELGAVNCETVLSPHLTVQMASAATTADRRKGRDTTRERPMTRVPMLLLRTSQRN
jgi:hypothetical protein